MNLFDEICKQALNESIGDNEVLNERPYSRTRSAMDSIKGKVKGLAGSGQVEQGARESGEYANRLWADFKRNMGRKYGKTPSTVSYEDVANFLKGNQIDPSKYLGANNRRSFSPQDVSQVFLKASSDIVDQYPGEKQEEVPKHVRVSPNADEAKPEEKPEAGNQNTGNNNQGNGNSQNPQSDSALSSSIRNLSPEKREQLLNLLG